MSVEIDMPLLADDNDETARLADLIEGVAGEWSPFEEQHGFSINGVDWETGVLPMTGTTIWPGSKRQHGSACRGHPNTPPSSWPRFRSSITQRAERALAWLAAMR